MYLLMYLYDLFNFLFSDIINTPAIPAVQDNPQDINNIVSFLKKHPLVIKELINKLFEVGRNQLGPLRMPIILIVISSRTNVQTIQDVLTDLLKVSELNINQQDNQRNTSPLIAAITSNYEPIVDQLLAVERLDINLCDNQRRSPLEHAFKSGNSAMTRKILTDSRLNVASLITPPLIMAIHAGDIENVQYTLKNVPHANGKFEGETLLSFVISCPGIPPEKRKCIVKIFLEQKGIDVNLENTNRTTPLMTASIYGHTDIVTLLLEKEGINIDARAPKPEGLIFQEEGEPQNDYTAEDFARYMGHSEIVDQIANYSSPFVLK